MYIRNIKMSIIIKPHINIISQVKKDKIHAIIIPRTSKTISINEFSKLSTPHILKKAFGKSKFSNTSHITPSNKAIKEIHPHTSESSKKKVDIRKITKYVTNPKII